MGGVGGWGVGVAGGEGGGAGGGGIWVRLKTRVRWSATMITYRLGTWCLHVQIRRTECKGGLGCSKMLRGVPSLLPLWWWP